MNKKSIKDVDIKNKRLLIRVDFNVPLDDNLNITDDNRIVESLPTIEYAIKNGAKVILMSHLGRPKGEVKEKMRLTPVAQRLGRLLNRPVKKPNDCIGPEVIDIVNNLQPGGVVLLENLRFRKEEEKNDPGFAEKLAKLGDLFVNDAFGSSHRAHASTEGITHYLESVSGFLVQKEIEYFEKVTAAPERPFVLILGGAKVSDKIPLIENMLNKVDVILIGGAMAYTFLYARGIKIGSSRYEADVLDLARSILDKAEKAELLLPKDHIACDSFDNPKNIITTADENIDAGYLGVDIGPKTIELFLSNIEKAGTILWNGPMGVFERDEFAQGTKMIAQGIAESSAISVVGGGDSAAAAKKFGVDKRLSHVSTGGGASLEYLEGRILPGIAALSNK
ncbi:MAG: phosphoglycerate kinase [Deltaproteobacteria bacterium]|nr:phosphoglycerate kinase [Deltaproteobacteria bacterium]